MKNGITSFGGTTGTKAIVVDEKGNILGKGYKEYSLITLPGGKIEQTQDCSEQSGLQATDLQLVGMVQVL